MKTIVRVTLSLVLVCFFSVFPQMDTTHKDTLSLEHWKKALGENDEYLHAIKTMDQNVIENAKVLIHNMQTKKQMFLELAKYHSEEIGRSLASSEEYLSRLQKRTEIAMDEIQVAYYAGLHEHYKKAMEDSKALQAELIKAYPANSVIEMEALNIYSEVSKAEKEQTDLEHKMNIPEPTIREKGK